MDSSQTENQRQAVAASLVQRAIAKKMRGATNNLEVEDSLCSKVKPERGPEPDLDPRHVVPPAAKIEDETALTHFDENDLDSHEFLSVAAAEIYRMRRARDHVLPGELTGEPAWDMLLALYSEEPARLTVSSICHGSGVPHTTAMRWVSMLEQKDLIQRVEHPRDQNLILLSLTSEGRDLVEGALRAMLRSFAL